MDCPGAGWELDAESDELWYAMQRAKEDNRSVTLTLRISARVPMIPLFRSRCSGWKYAASMIWRVCSARCVERADPAVRSFVRILRLAPFPAPVHDLEGGLGTCGL